MNLSIITINLNNKIGLQKTIHSVIQQNFTNFEFIIIDGDSNDGSKDVIKEFSRNIDYWISEPDKGIYNAMNKGINLAQGEYLHFLNSGDYFVNNDVLKDIFSKKLSANIVYTDGYLLDLKGVLKPTRIPDAINLLHLIDHSLFHQGTFILRDTFDIIGFYNESYKILGDREFFLKSYLNGVEFQKLNLLSVVMEPNGISQKNHKVLSEESVKMVASNTSEDYLRLYIDRMSLLNDLSFFKKSRLLRFFIKHRENFYINKILSAF